MSCYFRHIKDLFADAGVEVTAENRKDLDRKLHAAVGVEYKDCPAAGRKIKETMSQEGGRDKLLKALKK